MIIFRLQYHSIARCQSVMWLILLPTRSWTYTMKQQSSYSMNDLIPRTEFLKILKCDSPVYWMVTVCNYCVSVAAHSYTEHQKMQGTVSWDIQPYCSEQYLPVEWTAQDLLRPVCCLVLLRLQWSSVYVKSIIWDLLFHIKLKPMEEFNAFYRNIVNRNVRGVIYLCHSNLCINTYSYKDSQQFTYFGFPNVFKILNDVFIFNDCLPQVEMCCIDTINSYIIDTCTRTATIIKLLYFCI